MEQTPEIIMRCPKCGRDFDLDVVYCETCSVMLEPMEVEKKAPQKNPGVVTVRPERPIPESNPDSVEEKIEDVKIDTLKAGIEGNFVATLLLEIDQLKKRLSKKEKAFEATAEMNPDAKASSIARIGQGEAEMDELLKKVARLEAILENLKKKIESDISSLEDQIRTSGKPGAFWLLSEKARYGKMLYSELKTKKILLDIIVKKRDPSYFRNREIAKIAAGISIVICLSLLFAWGFFRTSQRQDVASVLQPAAQPPAPAPAALKTETKRISLSEKDIHLLLDDIKSANIKKDLALWSSRYSKDYLEDRKEGALEQWKKYDYISLEYQINNLKITGESATAVITWDMELFDKSAGWTKTSHTRLLSHFAVEDGKLKISSVKKL